MHTPGPWVVNAHGYDSPYMSKAFVEDASGSPVCGLWVGDGPDARLIAAAPDMLRVIGWALTKVDEEVVVHLGLGQAWLDDAVAAYRKAYGLTADAPAPTEAK